MKRLLYIGNKLSRTGINVTTIDTLGPLFASEGYTIYYSSEKRNFIFRILDMVFTTIKYRKKVDFVLIDTYSTLAFWYAFIVSQVCRIVELKYIPILHGGNLPNRLKKSPKFCRLIFSNAFVNVAPSNYLLEKFKMENYFNVIFIPNVLEINNYPYKIRSICSPKLLWVRSFAAIYNPIMAIDVFAKVKRYYPEAIMCMIGPDKDGSLEITKTYAKSLNVEVEFTGRMSKKEWIKKSENFDIFINTTHFDNTPVSVMEAMALGLPVISTNVGGIPYLIEHNYDALLVEDGNVNQMVNSITELIENSMKSQNIAQNARKKVEKFDWNIVKEQWELILT